MSKPSRTVRELYQSKCRQLPETSGVYVVRAPKDFKPEFMNPGTGGRFKGKNPNIDIRELRSRWWVPDSRELYIGKAHNLRDRVWLLLQFGHEKPVAHWGGRLIWQITQSSDLLLDWYEHDSPVEEEARFLDEFYRKYGRLPFANLTKMNVKDDQAPKKGSSVTKSQQPHRHPAENYTDIRSMILEELACLYLRLNGYFLIPNYLLHKTEEEGPFGLRGEADILAVRFPYQRERLSDGRIQFNDETLILPREKGLTDYIYAEVKEGRVGFNPKSIGGERGKENIGRVLEMLGFFETGNGNTPSVVAERAEEIHRMISARRWPEFPGFCDEEKRVCVRFIVFTSEGAELSNVRKHITLERIFSHVRERMKPGEPCREYRTTEGSPWKGLTGKIVRALDLRHERHRPHQDLREFIAHVSQLCFRASY